MPWPRRALLATALLPGAARAQAAPEILAAGATQHVFEPLLAAWPGPGTPPSITFDTVGAQRDRVRAGARPAVAALSEAAIAALRRDGPGRRRGPAPWPHRRRPRRPRRLLPAGGDGYR